MDSDTSKEATMDYTKHPAYAVLKGYGAFDLEGKKNLLVGFVDRKKTDLFPRWMLDHNSEASVLLSTLVSSGRDDKARKKNWNASFMAEKILQAYLLLQEALTDVEQKPFRPCAFVKSFVHKVKPVVDEALTKSETGKAKKKRSVINKQAASDRVQDRIPFSTKIACKQACPACGHYFNAIVDDKSTEIAAKKEEYKEALAEWERLKGSNKKLTKPKPPKIADTMVACYCFKQHCLLDPEGNGCASCKALDSNTLTSLHLRDPTTGVTTCQCDVCQCNCSVLFGLSKRHAVAIEAEAAKNNKGKRLVARAVAVLIFSPLILNWYILFTDGSTVSTPLVLDPTAMMQSALDNAAIMACHTDDAALDTGAIASQLLLSNPILASSVAAKKQLQTALGPKQRASTRAGGKPIDVLRQEQRVNPDAFNQQYQVQQSSNATTAMGARNARFFRNNLSKNKISKPAPPNAAPTTNASARSVTSLNRNRSMMPQQLYFNGTAQQPYNVDSPLTTPASQQPLAPSSLSADVDEKTPRTDLLDRARKRIYKGSIDKSKSPDTRKTLRATNRFIQKQYVDAHDLADMHIAACSDDYEPADSNEPTMSQGFMESLVEHVRDTRDEK